MTARYPADFASSLCIDDPRVYEWVEADSSRPTPEQLTASHCQTLGLPLPRMSVASPSSSSRGLSVVRIQLGDASGQASHAVTARAVCLARQRLLLSLYPGLSTYAELILHLSGSQAVASTLTKQKDKKKEQKEKGKKKETEKKAKEKKRGPQQEEEGAERTERKERKEEKKKESRKERKRERKARADKEVKEGKKQRVREAGVIEEDGEIEEPQWQQAVRRMWAAQQEARGPDRRPETETDRYLDQIRLAMERLVSRLEKEQKQGSPLFTSLASSSSSS